MSRIFSFARASSAFEHGPRMLGRECGHRAREDVAQHAAALLEAQSVALAGFEHGAAARAIRRVACRFAGCALSTAAPAPSPKRQALTSTPGSLSRYMAALLTSTHTESTCWPAPAASSASASRRFGSAATQPWPTRSKACTFARKPSLSAR